VLAHIRVQFERSQVRNQTRPFGSQSPPTDCQVGGLGGRLSARALINRFGGTFFVSFSHFDLPLISPSTLRLPTSWENFSPARTEVRLRSNRCG